MLPGGDWELVEQGICGCRRRELTVSDQVCELLIPREICGGRPSTLVLTGQLNTSAADGGYGPGPFVDRMGCEANRVNFRRDGARSSHAACPIHQVRSSKEKGLYVSLIYFLV